MSEFSVVSVWEDNFQNPEDCEGTIIPNVILGPKLFRDICEE